MEINEALKVNAYSYRYKLSVCQRQEVVLCQNAATVYEWRKQHKLQYMSEILLSKQESDNTGS